MCDCFRIGCEITLCDEERTIKFSETDTGCGLCAVGLCVDRSEIAGFRRHGTQSCEGTLGSGRERYGFGAGENNCALRQTCNSEGCRHLAQGCVIVIHVLQSVWENPEGCEGWSVQCDGDGEAQNR